MITNDLDALARKYSHSLDILAAIAIVAGTAGLFLFDMSAPRGEVDGVGYAALVALSIRFGDRVVIGCAILTTALTLLAAFIVPDSGISVAGMWANRGFAILEIWIVAIILLRRLGLEAYVADRRNALQVNQTALGRIVREVLLSNKQPDEAFSFITRECAEALGADFCIIFQRPNLEGPIRIANIWDRRLRRHFEGPAVPELDRPTYLRTIEKDFVMYADDVRTSEFHRPRLEFFDKLGIRAILSGATVEGRGRGAVSFAFAEPHHWTDEEFAFARAVANLTSLLLASNRNARTLAALEQVNEGIYLEEKDGEVHYANRAAREFPGSETGKFPRPDAPLTGDCDMHEISQEDRNFEVQRLRLPDGGILTRINDVTERNFELSERRRLEERLQRSAKMEAIGQLAGGVAHDFNNILGAILGFAGFLKQDLPEKSDQHRFAERILSACERGKQLVEQILAFARVRAVERGVVDLGLVLNRNQDYLAGLLPPGIKLGVHPVDGALPVFGSAVKIGQLVENLVLNARDSYFGGTGAIDVAVRCVPAEDMKRLNGKPDEPHERSLGEIRDDLLYGLLRVEDRGSGIAPEHLDRIFEPFFTTKGRHQGTGLGLSVVHGVVESLGGFCHLISIPGKGTVFSIYFPLAAPVADPVDRPVSQVTNLYGKERILIVDDETDIADMLSIGLERLGYQTHSVNDPRDALAAFVEDPMAFDLVVTDQVMPGLRGLELIRRLKEVRPSVRAILCTGYSDGATEKTALQAGADAFFQKPVDSRQVAGGIRALMSR